MIAEERTFMLETLSTRGLKYSLSPTKPPSMSRISSSNLEHQADKVYERLPAEYKANHATRQSAMLQIVDTCQYIMVGCLALTCRRA